MKVSGAKAVVESLKHLGVEVLFGIPGGALLYVYDALYDAQDDIRQVLCRHEQGAAHAADGYARVSGKVGVCVATSGPGATNLVTGIANAHMDSVPIVAITGQVPRPSIGRDSFQEADVTGITMPIVKHSYLVKEPQDIPAVFAEAFYLAATGRPGPVLVDLPKDVTASEFEFHFPEKVTVAGYRPAASGHRRMIKQAADLIAKSQRPIIYIGGGVITSGAHQELKELAEKTGIFVVNTLMGKGGFPESHSQALGMIGMHGAAYGNYALNGSDLIIALGARFDDRVTGRLDKFAPDAKVIHVDIDPAEIGKSRAADVPIVGDLKPVLKELNRLVQRCDLEPWRKQIVEWRERFPLRYAQSDERIKPQFLVQEVHRLTKGEAICVTDVGQHQMWAAQYYLCDRPRQFVTSGGLGTMGFGLPAAMGAQFARPDDLVVGFHGDGSIQMTIQEIATAVEHRLPLKIIIVENRSLGMVRQWQELFHGRRYSGTLFQMVPDFDKIAEAYGCKGETIERPEEIEPAFKRALTVSDTPYILTARVEQEENVMPMVPAGSALDEMLID